MSCVAAMQQTKRRCTLLVLLTTFLILAKGDGIPFAFSEIDDYTVERVLSSELADLDKSHWAHYAADACTYMLSDMKSGTPQSIFPSLNFTMSFFSVKNANWYASPSGFLTIGSRSMCPFFCNQANLQAESGNYQFTDSFGGDWPMAALFTADLTPMTQTGAYVIINSHSNANVRIIEYRNVPFQSNTTAGTLTAQVVLYANGTIIFRYASVPEVTAVPIFGNASTGLIFSAKSRLVVEAPSSANGIAAYRFNPQLVNCSTYASASDCESADGCNWCVFTLSCAPTSVVTATCLDSSAQSSQFTTSVFTSATTYTAVNMTTLQQNDSVSFSFPFFNSPVDTLYLTSNAVFSASSNTQNCNPSTNYCRNANYSYAIVPYQGGYSYSFVGTTAYGVWRAAMGEQMCTSSMGCKVLVLRVYYNYQVYQLPVRGTVYAYIYETGDMEFFYPSDNEYLAYPPPVMGIFRSGAEDPLSIQVPMAVVAGGSGSGGTLVRFAYVTNVSGCGTGFTDQSCTACSSGYYGASCTACACENGGTCDEGITGTGNCVCAAGYGGIHCADTCTSTAFTCSGCSKKGGYCECDSTECQCLNGWTGSTCSTNTDACLPLTLNGCRSCVASAECNYCFDGSCFSPQLSGSAAGYACSNSMNASIPYTCEMVDSSDFTISRVDIAVVVLMTLLLVLLIMCAILAIVSLCKRTLIYDRHVLTATGGAPDFRFTRRQREVVHANFIPPEEIPKDKFVLGIPLRQIQLDRLYQSQHKKLHQKGE